jgi:hypothetical protein
MLFSDTISSQLGVNADQVIVQSIFLSTNRRRKLLNYLLSSAKYSFTVRILDVTDTSSASTLSNAATTYIGSGSFANDLINKLNVATGNTYAPPTVSGVDASTVLAEAGTDYSCNLNSHISISWKIFESDNMVKMSLLSDSKTNWISAGVTHKLNPMVATSGHPNGVFIYQPSENRAGYYYMNGYSAQDIVKDTQSRVGTEIVLLQSQEGVSSMVFNYTGASNSGVSMDPEINFDEGNYVMWAHGQSSGFSMHALDGRGSVKINWKAGTCDTVAPFENIYYQVLIHVVPLFLVAMYLSGLLSYTPIKRALGTKPSLLNFRPLNWLSGGPLTIGVILSIITFIVVLLLLGISYNKRLDEVSDERRVNIITGDFAMVFSIHKL